MLGRRRRDRSAAAAPDAAAAADGSADPDPVEALLTDRLTSLETDLTAASHGTSLCSISKSGGRVDGVKYLEGRLAAVHEARREHRRNPDPALLQRLADRWRTELDLARERDAGDQWLAYRSGGTDELDELVVRRSSPATS